MEYFGSPDDVYYGDNQQSWWEQEQERADEDLEAIAEKRMEEAAKKAERKENQ